MKVRREEPPDVNAEAERRTLKLIGDAMKLLKREPTEAELRKWAAIYRQVARGFMRELVRRRRERKAGGQ